MALLFVVACVACAQTPKDAAQSTVQVAQPAVGVTELPADVLKAVAELRQAFEGVQRDKQMVEAREKQIQALLAVQFNRACAKAKLDPDVMEWTENLDGIRAKKK